MACASLWRRVLSSHCADVNATRTHGAGSQFHLAPGTWHLAKVLRVQTVNGVACHHTRVGVGLLTGVAVASFVGPSAKGTAMFAMTGVGGALLPDLDTSDSAVSHAAGRLLCLPLALFRKLVRRHRGVTHTLAACLIFAFGVFLLGYVAPVAEQYLPAR